MAASARVLAVAAACLLVGLGEAIEDYCSKNTYETNGTHMQFTKEATYEEFAIAGRFKGLHCCAKGYRSIEWYKDGKLYPWQLEVSHMILFPESANQTIYTQTVSEDDAGNYTCVLRNDSVVHQHTIHLKVYDKLPDDPKMTYVSQNVEIPLGHTFRLFCEAFGGSIDLPDAVNEAVWKKVASNGSQYDVPDNLVQKKINREDGQTFGTYLIFPEVTQEDYGNYICLISKPGNQISREVSVREKVEVVKYVDPNPFPVRSVTVFGAAVAALCLAAFVLYARYGLRVRVRVKDALGAPDPPDGAASDVLVAHAPKDAGVAQVLLAVLADRYRYTGATVELPPDVANWYATVQPESEKHRRVVAMLSPAGVPEWDSPRLQTALKQLLCLGPKLTCVALKELPPARNEPKNAHGETLGSLARAASVLQWQRPNDDAFWLSLRLRLPPMRRAERACAAAPAARAPRDPAQGACADDLV